MPFPTEAAVGLLGACIGVATTCLVYGHQHNRQLRTARMCIASELRRWLSDTSAKIYDVAQTDVRLTDEYGNDCDIGIPDFPFEKSLDQIALLDNKTSSRLFELLHAREATAYNIAAIEEHIGFVEAQDHFRGRTAKLYLDTLWIYEDLCRRIGWPTATFSNERRQMMLDQISRLERIDEEEARSNEVLLGRNG